MNYELLNLLITGWVLFIVYFGFVKLASKKLSLCHKIKSNPNLCNLIVYNSVHLW